MSRALASARARRANVTTSEPLATVRTSNTLQNDIPSQSGLTLPQVISLVDTRLVKLETFMKETKDSGGKSVRFEEQAITEYNPNMQSNNEYNDQDGNTIEEILEDFNNRFMVLANEIAELKDIVLKLQTYTMDVNKLLMEDRVRILSDLGQSEDPLFVMKGSNDESVSDSIEDGSSDTNVPFTFSNENE